MTRPGGRISLNFERISTEVVATAKGIPVAVVGDVSNRLFSFPDGFRNYSEAAPAFAGPAFTVRVRPGDNLFLHKALDTALPGDVIVCDAGGALENAILGEMMGRYAASRGIAAIIIDGAIRDRAGLASLPIPVFARGVTPNGPWKSGPGEIGYPVSAGGLSVASGDLVIGDADGVLVLPRADAPQVIADARKHAEVEHQWAVQIREGTWPRGWVDEALAKL
ncbi:RraA family protein [Xanthobacter sp. V0B-10]|uniref:RraA family protein n=1 Tax=Xanthobacter albus TaxID=3119929 RepID=UPI0037264865